MNEKMKNKYLQKKKKENKLSLYQFLNKKSILLKVKTIFLF